MSALLEVRALAAVADGNWLLRDVTIEVAEGSTVALVGGAGAGKTLLLQLLLGLAERRGGFIRLAGQDIGGLTPGQRQRLGLRCAFQRPPVFPGLDVREHLALAAPSVKLEAHAIERLADLIPELTGCLDQPVSGLDAPLLRLVDLGRALLGLPRVLLDRRSLRHDRQRSCGGSGPCPGRAGLHAPGRRPLRGTCAGGG